MKQTDLRCQQTLYKKHTMSVKLKDTESNTTQGERKETTAQPQTICSDTGMPYLLISFEWF